MINSKSQYAIFPFLVDKIRDSYLKTDKFSKLLETYTNKYSRINNFNTQKFWDSKFEDPEKIDDQDGMTKEKIDFIISQLPKKKSKILDLGIGQGYLEQRLKQLKIKHDTYGIDISKESIERSKQNFKGQYKVGDVLDIHKYYKNLTFDVIVAIEVIEHISSSQIFDLYKKIHNLLKPNGVFIISTPINEGLTPHTPNPSAHVRQYTIPILRFEFDHAKFRVNKIKTTIAFKNFYMLKKILSKIIFWKWQPNNVVIVAKKV